MEGKLGNKTHEVNHACQIINRELISAFELTSNRTSKFYEPG